MSIESGHILQVSRTLYVGLLQQYVKGIVDTLTVELIDIRQIALEVRVLIICNDYFRNTTFTCKPKLSLREQEGIRGQMIEMAVERYSK